MITKCLNCGIQFNVPPSVLKKGAGKYCSRKCQFIHKPTSQKIKCVRCGKQFMAKPCEIKAGKKYCSRKCFINQINKTCLNCGKTFKVPPSKLRNGFSKYCSHPCYCEHRKGNNFGYEGSKTFNWSGGRNKTQYGYIVIYHPHHPRSKSKYVREHILVAEKALNRFLTSEERIHHINGIKDDNRLENLYLFPNESEHQRHHKNVKYGNCKPICESNLIHINNN